jgi:polyferredoxin
MSWKSAASIAVAWIIFVLIVFLAAGVYAFHSLVADASSSNGYAAAVGFGVTRIGWIVILGPPVLLLVARFAADRV